MLRGFRITANRSGDDFIGDVEDGLPTEERGHRLVETPDIFRQSGGLSGSEVAEGSLGDKWPEISSTMHAPMRVVCGRFL